VSDPSTIAVAFVRALRRDGLPVPTSCSIGFAEALTAVGLSDRSGVYWAGRATLVRRREDIDPYDRVFGRFWDAVPTADTASAATLEESVTLAIDAGDEDGDDDAQADGDVAAIVTARLKAAASRRRVRAASDRVDRDLDELEGVQPPAPPRRRPGPATCPLRYQRRLASQPVAGPAGLDPQQAAQPADLGRIGWHWGWRYA
jgi:uncharacterized protein with von Willebrand factor type A (vWA) domain